MIACMIAPSRPQWPAAGHRVPPPDARPYAAPAGMSTGGLVGLAQRHARRARGRRGTRAGCMLGRPVKGLRARTHDRLLELDEVERRLKPFGRRYVGVREIRLDALVGTDSGASSFTRDFRPLHPFSR